MNPQPHTQHTPILNIAISNGEAPEYNALTVVPKIITHQGIYNAQRKQTLENYRLFVQQYADNCDTLNKDVLAYNTRVNVFIEQNELHNDARYLQAALNDELGNVSIVEYNEAVKIKNNRSGMLLLKQKMHVPVKKSTEHVFSMILFKYAMQIEEKNNILMQAGATTTRALQKVQINHYELANTVIDDVVTLPYCKRTIQNHVQRLYEAGVLFDYTFKGREKPVEYHVNPCILVVFCCKKKKSFSAENQLFSFSLAKELPNNVIDTRTHINKKEIIEPVKKQSRSKETETPSSLLPKIFTLPNVSDKNINKNTSQREQIPEQKQTGPREICKKMCDFLTESIEDRQTLVENHASGHYKNWRFYLWPSKNQPFLKVTMAHLDHEEAYGMMPKEDYMELLTQILFKFSGNIYRKANKNGVFNFKGSTALAYNEINLLLLNHNGSIPTKGTLLANFKGLMWRIKFAANYFNTSSQNPLFINEYFNPTRTTKGEGGFAYTLNFYKEHLSLENFNKKVSDSKQKQKIDSEKRKSHLKVLKLINKKAASVKNGKLKVEDYCNYIQNNAHIPHKYRDYAIKSLEKVYMA